MNKVARIGFTKVTSEQRPKGAMKVSKPCECVRQELGEQGKPGNPLRPPWGQQEEIRWGCQVGPHGAASHK